MNDQIEIKDLDQGVPVQADWLVFQKVSDGVVYKAPKSDIEGEDAFVYIAYADDDIGTGFTLTFDANKDYIAIKSTNTEIANPVVGDFAGLWKNYKGIKGDTGDNATADAGTTTTLAPGQPATVTNVGTTSDAVFNFGIPQGEKGDTGVGITSIVKTSTLGLVDTYTITYDDTTTTTFNVTNGAKGDTGDTGNGIASVVKTATVGLVDTYTITFTDLTTFEYDVTNGKDGLGSGDVSGPASAVDENIAVFDQATGKLIKDGGKKISELQLALGYTAENIANKSTNITTDGASDTKYPSVKAVKDYADGLVVGLWDDRGSYDASGNTYPATGGSGTAGVILKGDIWTISVAGTLGGVNVDVGDTVRALTDTPGQTSTNWSILENNIGYVPENVANKVTSFQVTPDDSHYPSEKLVKDSLDGKASLAGAETLTNKRITSRITTITSSATPTINTDNCDAVTITALAEAITSFTTNLSGTPTNFQKLIIRIKDNGTARAIAWGTSFEAKGVALPTTTVISKVLTVGFIYDTVTSKWGCVAVAQEA